MIKLNRLNKYFYKGKKNEIHVLNDITLSLPNKGLVVLLGASGSGKTTLLNVIGGLDKFASGSIQFGDEEISKYNVSKWDELRNETIGYIFQNYNLQPRLSVYDNVAFVLKMIGISDEKEIDKRVLYVLKALGMYDFRKKKALQLSGGQQQRVAIARALVKNPNIIIADEPTGNLDSKNTTEIMNIIKEIAKEKLVVLVTHEKELADFYANRVIEIVDGKIVSDRDNLQSEDHGLIDDQVIYLKDLNNLDNTTSEQLDINFYSDQPFDNKVKVDLIYKNNTLYLNVKTDIKKLKLANDQEGMQIKDAHYVKKTREQLLETTFDPDFLDHSDVKKDKKFVISAQRNIKIALGKVLSFGRKGKLMIASFILAGTIIAFALSILFTALIIKPNTPYAKNTFDIAGVNNTKISEIYSYSEFYNALNNDNYMIITGDSVFNGNFLNLTLAVPGFSGSVTKSGYLSYSDSLTNKNLKYGRLIAADNEIIISEGLANAFLNNQSGFIGQSGQSANDYGVWNFQDLLAEDYHFKISNVNLAVKIVGISKKETNNIYINENMYLNIISNYGFNTLEEAYNSATRLLVFSSDNDNFISNINDNRLTITDLYQKAYDENVEQNKVIFPTVIPIVVLFLGFTFIGFYFVIRSSMISRIQEIGIYRALGVKRIEIFGMFFFEILILTTISTLIGYLIGHYFVRVLSKSLLGQLNFFAVNSLSFILGIILVYGFNLIAGLLPVAMLLRKTPAQILTQFDI